MGCNCGSTRVQYEAVDAGGKRIFGPSPFKTTVDAMAARHPGAVVREVKKEGA